MTSIATSQPFPTIVLASGSRYRADLLRRLELPFETAIPEVIETRKTGEPPEFQAQRLAREKARTVAEKLDQGLVIGSDQVAILDGEQLSKPGNRENAIRQLLLASGKWVEFFTALCVVDAASGKAACDLDRCLVKFRILTPQQITRYIDREQPFDCAGSFKSENLGIALLECIKGNDPTALIGLPLMGLIRILENFGVDVP